MPNIAYVSGISSQIFPYFLMLFPAILVNPLVNKCALPTGFLRLPLLGAALSVPIELHMGVNIQRHADVRMTHDILQCLRVHAGFRHIGTEGVSAYMGMTLEAELMDTKKYLHRKSRSLRPQFLEDALPQDCQPSFFVHCCIFSVRLFVPLACTCCILPG